MAGLVCDEKIKVVTINAFRAVFIVFGFQQNRKLHLKRFHPFIISTIKKNFNMLCFWLQAN
jgi:hypothetical protein